MNDQFSGASVILLLLASAGGLLDEEEFSRAGVSAKTTRYEYGLLHKTIDQTRTREIERVLQTEVS